MECTYCKNTFSSKTNLNNHQKRAKYCLKLRNTYKQETEYKCDACERTFSGKFELNRHLTTCRKNDILKKSSQIIQTLKDELISVKKENELLRHQLKNIQERYDNLSLTAVKRPTTTNKNIQINNYIKNMPPLLESDISDNVQYLTLEHHVKGAEGYAEYALEFPFKDKIVCVDVARNKIKYKNEEGDIIEDVGFKKMMMKLCDALKTRSFDLSQIHYEKLSDKFTESEMEEYNFLETAMAISKCAAGRENEFCAQIIRMIGKSARYLTC